MFLYIRFVRVAVYKVRQGRIRRTNIICNELIYLPLESVREYKPCGQTDRFAFTKTETQFYELRICNCYCPQ